jgi:shikimate kinase
MTIADSGDFASNSSHGNFSDVSAPHIRPTRLIDRSCVLVGFMAAGKSKIGRHLAARLQTPFADVDREIEEEYGCSVADLFRERGEAEFRKAERRKISQLLEATPRVIAVGGGAFVDEVNREALNSRSVTVWLDTPFEMILPRVRRSATRPLALRSSEEELRALWEKRREAYQGAHVRIDTSDGDVEAIVERIIAALD